MNVTKPFEASASTEQSPKWQKMISRQVPLYARGNDIRSEFGRDYTRILHSTAYRRLKNKTQVFFSPQNDHICTRIEHVNHVESISYTIADFLGLNTELTKAISVGHDLGHAPFGHQGEKVISEIAERDLGFAFWHERNGLFLVDKIELLEDNEQNKQNLDLTYAVRDGIISHCGEVDQNGIKPRKEPIDLSSYTEPNEYNPFTWEGCVVKIADKISYVGRDIEDAITIGILDREKIKTLSDILASSSPEWSLNAFTFMCFADIICSTLPQKSEAGARFVRSFVKISKSAFTASSAFAASNTALF
jgi:dGTPase